MALSAKIYRFQETQPLDIIYEKLVSFSNSEVIGDLELKEYFYELNVIGNLLKGMYVYDEVITLNIEGNLKDIPVRREVYFSIYDYRDGQYLIVFEKKRRANKVAMKMSEIIFIKGDMILEARIPHEILKGLHESAPEATKVIYFDNLDLPNINKIALYGDALADTSLYSEYLKHGLIWYVVFQHKETGYIVGITRNAIVAMFTNITLMYFYGMKIIQK